MGAIVTLIIVIAILIIASPILGQFAGDFIDERKQEQEDAEDSKTFGNTITSGDIVCDLYVRIDGELDRDRTKSDFQHITDLFSSDDLIVYIEGSDVVVEHDNCFVAGNGFSSALSFISKAYTLDFAGLNLNSIANLPQASLLVPANDFEFEMTGKSKTTGKLLTEGILGNNPQKRWIEEVKVESEFFDVLIHVDSLPIKFTVEYFLDDVKNDDYAVEFVAIGKRINDQQSDFPYRYDLQKARFQ